MKAYLTSLAAVLAIGASALLVGCNTSAPGGTGSNTTNKKDSFTVTGPATTTDVMQEETKELKLTLSPGSDFKQDVTLSHGDLPKGVTVTFDPAKIKSGDKKEAMMKVAVAPKADTGPAKILVKAKPEKGDETSLEVKIDVKEKK